MWQDNFISFPSHPHEKESSSILQWVNKKICLKFDHSRRTAQASLRLQAGQQAGFQGRTEGRTACAEWLAPGWAPPFCGCKSKQVLLSLGWTLGRMLGWQEVQSEVSCPSPSHGRGQCPRLLLYWPHRKAIGHAVLSMDKNRNLISNTLWCTSGAQHVRSHQRPTIQQTLSAARGLGHWQQVQPWNSSALCSSCSSKSQN